MDVYKFIDQAKGARERLLSQGYKPPLNGYCGHPKSEHVIKLHGDNWHVCSRCKAQLLDHLVRTTDA